jgi:hypothetical protein
LWRWPWYGGVFPPGLTSPWFNPGHRGLQHSSANCCAEEVFLASRAPSESLLELDQALERMGQEDPRLVMLVEMRFFAGMTTEETGESTRESVLRRGCDG